MHPDCETVPAGQSSTAVALHEQRCFGLALPRSAFKCRIPTVHLASGGAIILKLPACVLFCCADGSESPAATVPFLMKPEVSQEEKKTKPTRPQAVVINRRRKIAAGAAITGAGARDESNGAAAVGLRRSFSGRIGSSIARRLGLHSRSVSRENQVAPAPSHGHNPTKVSCAHSS